MFQHILSIVIVPANVGRNVWQDDFFTGVILDNFRYISVDHLIVGNSRSRGIGHCQTARLVNTDKPLDAQQGIGSEHLGIDKVVIDSSIKDIHPLKPFGGEHMNVSVFHHQVLSLYKFHTHLLGEKGVFEIGTVVNARGQHTDGGIGGMVRGHVFEHLKQFEGIVIYRPYM